MDEKSLSAKELTLAIKNEVLASGFSACRVASVSKLETSRAPLEKWLDNDFHGSMEYMTRNIEKRLDPSKLVSGAKSIIVAAINYFPVAKQNPESKYLVSKYAYGTDYHFIIKEKLHLVAQKIQTLTPEFECRVFTDSAPVLEREWAVRAGLGWIGKNGCLILPKKGSFFFLAEIISNLDLVADKPFLKNFCGTCNKCVESCPTSAIVEPGVVDARKCISYLTIESKTPIPESLRGKTGRWIFGCDTCQDVCPHNRFSTPTTEKAFEATGPIKNFETSNWENLNAADFEKNFKKGKSPPGRIKYEKLQDNINAANFSKEKMQKAQAANPKTQLNEACSVNCIKE